MVSRFHPIDLTSLPEYSRQAYRSMAELADLKTNLRELDAKPQVHTTPAIEGSDETRSIGNVKITFLRIVTEQ
ncbi:MAG: hypothetical protein IH840_00235 [Candidatus Heimdallarchaeota archaeon]|nr:hypothetical protein [Candidatus Heimdallarchaeota archaeon]